MGWGLHQALWLLLLVAIAVETQASSGHCAPRHREVCVHVWTCKLPCNQVVVNVMSVCKQPLSTCNTPLCQPAEAWAHPLLRPAHDEPPRQAPTTRQGSQKKLQQYKECTMRLVVLLQLQWCRAPRPLCRTRTHEGPAQSAGGNALMGAKRAMCARGFAYGAETHTAQPAKAMELGTSSQALHPHVGST